MRENRHTLVALYMSVAIWASLPASLHAQIGCIRLDDHRSPTSYSSAWGEHSPTRFEISDGGLGKVELSFDDSQTGVTIILDALEAHQFVDQSRKVMSNPPGESTEIGFTAWFKLGPAWHRTGLHMGRGVLSRSADTTQQAGQFTLEFHRLISETSSYTTYLPSTLYFNEELLTQVADVVGDGLAGSANGRACGYAGMTPDRPGY